MTKQQLILLETCVAIGIAALLFLYLRPKHSPSEQAKLVEVAMNSQDLTEQQKAVAQLAETGPGAAEHLRHILSQCPKTEIKLAAIYGLSQVKDWDSGPELFRLLEDFSQPTMIRSAAAATVSALAENKQYVFLLDDPEYQQRDTIARIRQLFEEKKAALQNPKNP